MTESHSVCPYAPPEPVEQSQLRYPWYYKLVECEIGVAVIGFVVGLVYPSSTGLLLTPIEVEIQACMVRIEMATVVSHAETGVAPTTLEGLKGLIDRGYIAASPDPDDLVWQMLSEGTDYFGNPLRLQPMQGKPGYYELRSSGRDGRFDTSNASDDIFIEYPARI